MEKVKFHLGGTLGVQYNFNPHVALGIVDHWMVVWWGKRFQDAAFFVVVWVAVDGAVVAA